MRSWGTGGCRGSCLQKGLQVGDNFKERSMTGEHLQNTPAGTQSPQHTRACSTSSTHILPFPAILPSLFHSSWLPRISISSLILLSSHWSVLQAACHLFKFNQEKVRLLFPLKLVYVPSSTVSDLADLFQAAHLQTPASPSTHLRALEEAPTFLSWPRMVNPLRTSCLHHQRPGQRATPRLSQAKQLSPVLWTNLGSNVSAAC